jgi:hypothetical protein
MGWVDPVPDPLLLRKSGSAGYRTRDLWVSSEELWSLDHRGGPTWLTCQSIFRFTWLIPSLLLIYTPVTTWGKTGLWCLHAVCVCVFASALSAFESVDWFSWNLVWMSCHWRPPQHRKFSLSIISKATLNLEVLNYVKVLVKYANFVTVSFCRTLPQPNESVL